MKNLAAAEHSKHYLLAKNGLRTVYPNISHANMFEQADEILRHIESIYDVLSDSK